MVYSHDKGEREQYNNYRLAVCQKLGIREFDYNRFRHLGRQLHKIYIDECNGILDEKEYEDLTAPFYEVGDRLSKSMGLYIYYQTDPRGGTIYISREPIPKNNYTIASLIY